MPKKVKIRRGEKKRMHLKLAVRSEQEMKRDIETDLLKGVHFHADTVRRKCEGCGFDTSWQMAQLDDVTCLLSFIPFYSSSGCW